MKYKSPFKLKITGKILLILLGLSLLSGDLCHHSRQQHGRWAGTPGKHHFAGRFRGQRQHRALTKRAEEQLLFLAIDQAAINNAMFDKVESEVR
jgi:hypothetical protein